MLHGEAIYKFRKFIFEFKKKMKSETGVEMVAQVATTVVRELVSGTNRLFCWLVVNVSSIV